MTPLLVALAHLAIVSSFAAIIAWLCLASLNGAGE